MERAVLFVGIAAVLFAAFFAVYKWNKTRLLSGFLFCVFLLWAGFSYCYGVLILDIAWLTWTVYLIALGIGFVLLFGLYILIALLFWNARIVAKKERRSLANRLTLILAVALVAFLVVSSVINFARLPWWVHALWGGVVSVLVVYFFHVFIFLASSLLCNLARPKPRQNYIIVLGSGLVEGQVTPLLAGRINRAIRFYLKQRKKREPPKLVMSGGRGSDEQEAEGVAMARYARDQGIPEKDILVEDKAANTAENMRFSKAVMDAHAAGGAYRCIYATSNYHLLRSGVLARKAGLAIDGIGAKTAWYYLPNALLREYVAFFRMNIKGLLVLAALVFLGGAAGVSLPAIVTLLASAAG